MKRRDTAGRRAGFSTTGFRMTGFSMRGFSMVELMVAMLISSLMVVVMSNVFMADEAARNTQESLSEVQNNGRVAINWLKYDLRMAGHTAQTYTRSPVALTTVADLTPVITSNCFTTGSQAFDWGLAILPRLTGEPVPMVFGVDNVTDDNTVFDGCIDNDELQPGSDILSVHYAATEDVADADLVEGNIYLNSGVGGAVVFQCDADGTDCKDHLLDARTDVTGTRNHRLISRAYFVRNFADEEGDAIPTLVRADMAANGTVSQQVLIPGITSMQLTYGVDTDNDGGADQFLTADALPALSSEPGLPQWTKVKSVRVALLTQSTTPDYSRVDAKTVAEARAGAGAKGGVEGEDGESKTATEHGYLKTFDVGGSDVALAEAFSGKVYSTTVAVRNPSARMTF